MIYLILSIVMNLVMFGLAFLLVYINNHKQDKNKKIFILSKVFIVLVGVLSICIFGSLVVSIILI